MWFFSIVFPKAILEALESDAQQLYWAAHPELYGDEEGSMANKKNTLSPGALGV